MHTVLSSCSWVSRLGLPKQDRNPILHGPFLALLTLADVTTRLWALVMNIVQTGMVALLLLIV